MANEPAPAAAPATPAAPSQAVTVGAPAPAPAVVDPSTAGRTLAQLRNERREALSKGAPPSTDPKGTGTSGTNGSGSAPGAAQATGAGTAPGSPGGSPAGSAAATGNQADDDEIAVLIEAQRAHRDTARQLDTRTKELEARETALKEHEAHIPAIVAARKAMTEGDVIGAMTAVFGRDYLTRELLTKLAEGVDQLADQPPVDLDAEFEKRFQARDAAAKAEAEKKTAEARAAAVQARDSHDGAIGVGFGAGLVDAVKTINVGGREIPTGQAPPEVLGSVVAGYASYVQQAFGAFNADQAKYPGLSKFRPTALDVVKKVEQLRAGPNGKVPDMAELLKAMEEDIAGSIRGTPYAAPAPPAAAPSTSVNSSWQRHEGAPAPAAAAPLTVDQRREAHRAALRAGSRAT